LRRGHAGSVEDVRSDAGPVQDETGAAERASGEAFRIPELDLSPALRAGNSHGAGGATASPQLVQNFVPGGSTVRQWPQVSRAFRSAPQVGQYLA